MARMRRIATAICAGLALALALPAGAPATLTEVGIVPATTPPTVPSCPASPCLAVSRTTGFQVKVGTAHNFLAARRSGTIVAWTITLGKPSATQIGGSVQYYCLYQTARLAYSATLISTP